MKYSLARKIGQNETVRKAVTAKELYDAMDVIVEDERFTESEVTLYQSRIEDELCRRGY